MAVGAKPEVAGYERAVVFAGIEDHTLTLSQHAEKGTFERTGTEEHLVAIIAPDDAYAGFGVVYLDDSLHRYAFSTLPALMQDVHTRTRLLLLPCLTRTRWMLGNQRRLERL